MSTITQTTAAVPAAVPAAAATTKVNDVPAAQVPEVEGFRVYIGNLAFTATEEQVRKHLETAGGEIAEVTLPTRYKSRRPAGYAFATYTKEADAKNAVAKLNDTEIGERKVQLELARSKEENTERRAAILEKRKEEKAAAKAAAAESAPADDEAADKPKKSKAKSARRRGPEDGDEAAADSEEGDAAPKAAKTKKAKEPKAANGEETKKAPKERKPRLVLTGEESKNTVFVANLPFTIDDDALAALFTDLSISVKSAHVVKGQRKLPNRRPFHGSKGFGFVELVDEKQQAEAVEKVNGITVGDRKVTARVAQEMKPIEDEGVAAAAESKPAAAETKPAAAVKEEIEPAAAVKEEAKPAAAVKEEAKPAAKVEAASAVAA